MCERNLNIADPFDYSENWDNMRLRSADKKPSHSYNLRSTIKEQPEQELIEINPTRKMKTLNERYYPKKSGCIYIACDEKKSESDLYKVGKTTRSLKTRIRELSTAYNCDMKIVNHYEVKDVHRMERLIHAYLKKNRIFITKNKVRGNEWFEMDKDQLQLIVPSVIKWCKRNA